MGDLNSNSCWDVPDRWWNHSDVVPELRNIGLHSAYHCLFDEAQGHETIPTFYMYRGRDRPYHIDYVFASKCLLKDAVLVIGDPGFWLEASDHLPLFLALSSLDFS
jgi:endonuclease/exonuclease/phosphatase family metal-dependent hydrolase